MGFVLGVLVISALLSVIFGKRVGAFFATGVLGAAGVLVSVCIWLFILVLYTNGFWSYHPKPDLPEYSSTVPEANGYGAGYVPNQAPYYPASTPTPTYQASAPAATSQAAAPPASYQAQVPSDLRKYAPPPPSAAVVPLIGVTYIPAPKGTVQNMNANLTRGETGDGCLITSIDRGSPAQSAGLQVNDVVLAGGAPGQTMRGITLGSYELPDILKNAGFGVPVALNVYRPMARRELSLWVKPR